MRIARFVLLASVITIWFPCFSTTHFRSPISQETGREEHATEGDKPKKVVEAKELAKAIRDEEPIRIYNAIIRGPLDLSYVTINQQVSLVNCEFEDQADFSYATFKRHLILQNSTFKKGFDFEGATIELDGRFDALKVLSGKAGFRHLHVQGLLNLEHAQFDSAATANFSNAHVDKGAYLRGIVFGGEVNLTEMRIGGDLVLTGAHFRKEARFATTKIAGSLFLESAHFDGPAYFAGIETAYSAKLPKATFQNRVSFSDIKVNSFLDLSGAKFEWPDEPVHFGRAQVVGGGFLDGVHFSGGARFDRAHFSADTSFDRAVFERAASFDQAHFDQVGQFENCIFKSGVSFHNSFFGTLYLSPDGQVGGVDQFQGGVDRQGCTYTQIHGGWQSLRGQRFLSNAIGRALLFYEHNHEAPWFWPIATMTSALGSYVVAMMALFLLAWHKGSTIFSRTWLLSKAAQPLLVAPGLGRRALFLGYARRLGKHKVIGRVAIGYFGLPAEAPDGNAILPDESGRSLHDRIGEAARPQQPVLIIGAGGAGKSTLLARLALLGLKGQLPESLHGFLPVFVSAGYYSGRLVKAITDTLRERDGVGVTEEIVTAQLQSGRFLILFDGVTEVATEDKHISAQEILRTAGHFDYRASRFIIATRPLDRLPRDVPIFRLRPLTPQIISGLLRRYHLGTSNDNHVRVQLQSFGSRPIEPLLLTMILTQSASEQISHTRANLYEAYFRRLLRAESDEQLWNGWCAAFENLAQWFLLDTGNRGIGLLHGVLMNRIAGVTANGKPAESLITSLRRLYHFPAKDDLEFIQNAEASGLLLGGRRWRFAHDTFEEYFAAKRLVSIFEESGTWPALDKWTGSPEREQDLLEVLRFIPEMCDDAALNRIRGHVVSTVWKEALRNRD